MNEEEELSRVWAAVQRQLPDGWTLDGLRCASTGLAPGDRSDDWVAVARGPDGSTVEHRAHEPDAALRGLVSRFEQPLP